MRHEIFVTALIILASTAMTTAKDWVKDKGQCQYESMLRNRLAIEDGKIYGLESECDILKSQMKDGYTYADIACSAEGQDFNASIRFKVDEKGMHYKQGNAEEILFPQACP